MTEPAYRYRAQVRRVIDGDTYVLDIDLGLTVTVRATIRLKGWNCPERNTPQGVKAAQAADLLLRERPVIVEIHRALNKEVQSFARWVADVYLNGQHVGITLSNLGHAEVAQ